VGDGAFPREQYIEQAAKILAAFRSFKRLRFVFVRRPELDQQKLVSELNPAILHLGAHTDICLPADSLSSTTVPFLPIMRSIPVVGARACRSQNLRMELPIFCFWTAIKPATKWSVPWHHPQLESGPANC